MWLPRNRLVRRGGEGVGAAAGWVQKEAFSSSGLGCHPGFVKIESLEGTMSIICLRPKMDTSPPP